MLYSSHQTFGVIMTELEKARQMQDGPQEKARQMLAHAEELRQKGITLQGDRFLEAIAYALVSIAESLKQERA